MRGAAGPDASADLDARKQELERTLRSNFQALSRDGLKSHPVLRAYAVHYKRFDKTYHVQLQLESVVFKGKTIPRVAPLVEAMFMAELKNLLLTAGHDLEGVRGEVSVDIAQGSEEYLTIGGEVRSLKAGDMYIRDEEGVLSSIIYGPASRARITPATGRLLFTVYCPAGIGVDLLRGHLGDIRENVVVVAPQAEVEWLQVVSGQGDTEDRGTG
jgi:DNA/RNA-binding domain of Phe-tRNA-synthetase-like protein